jgi:hypothetical protein
MWEMGVGVERIGICNYGSFLVIPQWRFGMDGFRVYTSLFRMMEYGIL